MFRHFLGPDLLKGCDSGCGFNRFCEHTNILSTVLHVIGIKIYRSQKTRALEFLVFALLCGLPFFFIYDLEGGLRYRILISSFGIGVLSYVSFYLLISKNKKNFAEKLSSSAFLILGLIHSYRFFVFSGVHTPVDDLSLIHISEPTRPY